MNFTFELPTRIHFGTKITETALKKEARWLQGNILIITTGNSLIHNGYIDELKEYLQQIDSVDDIFVYDKISRNPRLSEAKNAAAFGKKVRATVVIGFGGGSSLDAAKAVAVGVAADEELEEYLLRGKEPSEATFPIIAIPTTAGTGSELSKGAIITSEEHHIKTGIRGKNILPKAAIVDSYYTWTVPKHITLETGFDVLAHAIETYMAVKADFFSETLSEKAVKLVAENLPLLAENIDNREAREKMCFASMIMGINLANIGTCFPHRMQYAIGAATDTSHAAGLIAVYPSWIKHQYEVNGEKVSQVLAWMGYPGVNSAESARLAIESYLSMMGINRTLTDLGVGREDVVLLEAQVTGNLANDRLADYSQALGKILRESI